MSQNFADNAEAIRALELMETGENIFLTGEAGTGKSTLLKHFRDTTKRKVVVLASTGVAAVNVDGQTLHSFCGFQPNITIGKVRVSRLKKKRELVKNTKTIIIDEISMIRADLLDCVDKYLRLNGPHRELPFGGIQLILVGDPYQLPPVDKNFLDAGALFQEYASPHFFDAKSFASGRFTCIELTKIYRQSDPVFLKILNDIRNNTIAAEDLGLLNERACSEGIDEQDFGIYITTRNARANEVNDHFLGQIDEPVKTYRAKMWGIIKDSHLLSNQVLRLKMGARVMLLNNDPKGRWVNGTVGTVVGFEPAKTEEEFKDGQVPFQQLENMEGVLVELGSREIVTVHPFIKENFEYFYNKNLGMLDTKTLGTFTQYPLRLAWAVTIHKSQGCTFDKIFVDLADGTFAHGQLYVALSRCRTLDGLTLRQSVRMEDIILDERVIEFMKQVR